MKPTYKKKETGSNIPTSTFFESNETTKQYNDRLDYLLVNSIGHQVKVTVASGIQYLGLLVASNLDSKDGVDIVLQNPQRLDNSNSTDDEPRLESNGNLLIHGSDVMELELNKIDLNLDDSKIALANENAIITPIEKETTATNPPTESIKKPQFKTDVDISGNNKPLKERELQKWVPDELPLDSNSTLKESPPQTLEESSGTWDQFSVNEQKFGVKSTYDEHFYTTKINKNDPNYQERLKEAQRLAEEIENQGTSGNIHLAEDRGIIIDDSGMDEEDLYSGVDRRGDELLASLKKVNISNTPNGKDTDNNNVNKPNKYVPPTLRNQPHHMDPAIISSTTAKNNVVVPSIPTPAQSPKVEIKETKDNTETKETKEVKEASKPVKPNMSRKESLPHDSVASRALHNHHTNARESPKPRIPLPSSKEAQIEELKNFSEKFKVPYEVPKDMKRMDIKSSPSQSGNAKPNDGNKTHQRRRPQGSFFGAKKSRTGNKKDIFNKEFNFFTKAKQIHDEEKGMEPFFIEKPYFTAPTWNGTVEESFKNFFPDEGTAIQQAQMKLQKRQMAMNGGAMNPAAAAAAGMMGMNKNGMMFSGAGGPNMGGAGGANMRMNNAAMMGFPSQTGMNPMMNGFPGAGGMYVPFQPQPMFYPNMGNPMMPMMGAGGDDVGSNPPSQTTSPQVPHVYMNTGAPPFGFTGNTPPFHPIAGGNNNNNNQNHNNNSGNTRERNNHYHGHRGPRNNNRNAAQTQT